MTDEPRWHGWATPDQVRQMMMEMIVFLEENNEYNPVITREMVKKTIREARESIDAHLRR